MAALCIPLRQAFSIQPLLVGGNPFDTTSIYGLIHFLEQAHGVHFAKGGTGALVKALGDLMERQEIEVKLNSTVTGLNFDGKEIKSAQIESYDNTQYELNADWIISNIDPAYLYQKIVPTHKSNWLAKMKAKKSKTSMGLFVLFFGTDCQYPKVAHHTLWMGPRYEGLLDDIFNKKIIAKDFSLYLHRPTATDASFAPEGHDSFYALVPVPNLQGEQDWKKEASILTKRIIDALDATTLPGLADHIVDSFCMTPKEFEHNYLSPNGAGFSISPLFTQSAWFRFHNRGEGPSNLLLVGSGTHPGAGLPGVITSAKVLDTLLPDAK